jgi:hypothetical protein
VRTRALTLIYSGGQLGTIVALVSSPLIIQVGRQRTPLLHTPDDCTTAVARDMITHALQNRHDTDSSHCTAPSLHGCLPM